VVLETHLGRSAKQEGFYSLAVIDWVKWYAAWMKARADLGMKPESLARSRIKKVKAELNEKYAAVVDDGMKNLDKALQIDHEYDDAMAYMNLLIREKADLDDTTGAVQSRRGKGRCLGPEGARYQEDESGQKAAKAAGGITTESK